MSLPGRLHLGRRSSAETAEIHSRQRPGSETIPLDLYRSAAANPYLRNHRDSVLGTSSCVRAGATIRHICVCTILEPHCRPRYLLQPPNSRTSATDWAAQKAGCRRTFSTAWLEK